MKRLIAALRHPQNYEWRRLRPFRTHSMVLLVAGVIYILIGATYIFTPMTPSRAIALERAMSLLPIGFWGGLFMAVGLLCLLSSRWPPASETWGYSALSALSSGWAVLGALSFAWAAAPSVLIFSLLAFLWWAISRLVNPEDLHAAAEMAAHRANGGH